MPIESSFLPITVPPVDLWTFFFEKTDREYPVDHVLYVDIAAQKRLTFRDIRTAAEQFGRGLLQHWRWHGGDVLALMTPNSADVAAVIFGTLFAGGVVCPLNNLYTVGELVSQLESSKAKALATNVACLEVACKAASIVGLPLDRILLVGDVDSKSKFQHFSSLQNTSASTKKVVINPKEDLAFLVYSSGTTGLPKGVMLTHENMVANILQNHAAEAGLLDWKKDRSLGVLPMYHIYGIAVLILAPLHRGVTTYIMQRFDLGTFCSAIEQERITIAYIVPPIALALAKSPLIDQYNLRSLRMLHSSAAPTAKDVIGAVHRRLGVPVKQGYGLSEASPGVASQSLEDWNKPIGCSGRLIASMSLKIMHNGKEVSHREEGEIWIKGPNIFKGYYNNPRATAESIDAEGWYRTGDVGYVDEQNNIYITDRVKELIKYNGFQVAPAQLEGLLLAHPAVVDVAVIGVHSDQRGTELPRAYIVVADGYKGDGPLEQDLYKWLHERVAPYKRLRGGIRFVDTIPKSNAGKLLRRVLVEKAKQVDTQEVAKPRL
ncbi:phenylacetyl-CoA ligase [Zopfia rhizophila CBS 207.26]|uniref:Phenylacetyl-CoA ligase n=1 Tax=Zopfia rhizophila CBS 207.26 TaxID=1314779 RepID=A0A6A6DCA5_9PEZI|nr:phenylacetyl-CoA ligase [Zopfia rhizophila CBS 207.26]